ncbi:hypothetical protein [Dyadobacter sp. BHUBP1]|uniref:hypothetical protein n=1 Tax=Dyadobacter sp. BHUBP1 TaxID=3424178 RepID=UPI003D33F84F
MGKRFYASHADKLTAMRMANNYAKAYKKGVCYTPSKEKECRFDSNTNLWTCSAPAHHQYGSCGSGEISTNQGRGTNWGTGKIPVITFDKSFDDSFAKENDEDLAGTAESLTDAEYSDASPEDYEDISSLTEEA